MAIPYIFEGVLNIVLNLRNLRRTPQIASTQKSSRILLPQFITSLLIIELFC